MKHLGVYLALMAFIVAVAALIVGSIAALAPAPQQNGVCVETIQDGDVSVVTGVYETTNTNGVISCARGSYVRVDSQPHPWGA